MSGTPTLEDQLRAARDAGVIDAAAFERLCAFLQGRAGVAPAPAAAPSRFSTVNMLWYLGALIVLGSMGLFSTIAFSAWGVKSLLATSVIYAFGFTLAGAALWRRDLHTPGGLLVACAVGMAPMFIYSVQALAGHDPIDSTATYRDFYIWVKSGWLPMELGTIAAALVALVFFPFPFLTMIIAFALWFMSMDLTPFLLRTDSFTYDQRATVSMVFGALTLAAAWAVDLKKWRNGDFAFWLHLFGMLAFWGGLTAHHGGDEIAKAFYCVINLALLGLAVFLMRRVYAVFGGIGVTMYLGYLSEEVFQNSILFPFALSAIGLGIIGAGLFFHYRGGAIAAAIGAALPEGARLLRPAHAREV